MVSKKQKNVGLALKVIFSLSLKTTWNNRTVEPPPINDLIKFF
jgi:hypothetical protein